MPSRLYIIATPIGNLSDKSERMSSALKASDLVLAEDTRVTLKLLNHLGLKKRILSCHDHNEKDRAHWLKQFADVETIALVSDAGMPLVSDPGYLIVQSALSLGMTIEVIPGPSAILTALVGSGLPADRFVFEGFLPDKEKERKKQLTTLLNEERTIIFFIAPSNLKQVIEDMLNIFGNRSACLAREMTKLHEEYIRMPLMELSALLKQKPVRGECVLVVAGSLKTKNKVTELADIKNRLYELLSTGGRLKDIARILAYEYELPVSKIYELGLEWKKKK